MRLSSFRRTEGEREGRSVSGGPPANPHFSRINCLVIAQKMIRHGGVDWSVDVKPDPRDDRTDEPFWGEINFVGRKITLDGQAPSEHQSATLLHELIHLLCWKAGEPLDNDTEEMVCRMVSLGFMDLFIQNPWLLTYLQSVVNSR